VPPTQPRAINLLILFRLCFRGADDLERIAVTCVLLRKATLMNPFQDPAHRIETALSERFGAALS
jgi:hypothetical protein